MFSPSCRCRCRLLKLQGTCLPNHVANVVARCCIPTGSIGLRSLKSLYNLDFSPNFRMRTVPLRIREEKKRKRIKKAERKLPQSQLQFIHSPHSQREKEREKKKIQHVRPKSIPFKEIQPFINIRIRKRISIPSSSTRPSVALPSPTSPSSHHPPHQTHSNLGSPTF